MSILVTGGTGRLGTEVVNALRSKGAEIRVLTRDVKRESYPGVEYVVGDLQDPQTVRTALEGVDKLFLLVANVADELTQTLLALELARELGIKHLTYLSVYKAESFPQVPHFIVKSTVETALRASGVPFTVLRAGYFYQNAAILKDALTGPGLFPTPIGTEGVAAIDIRDIAEVAALSLTEAGHEGKSYDLAGPALTGPGAASSWTEALGKPVIYPGLTPVQFEQQARQFLPAWLSMELRMMFEAYERGEFVPLKQDIDALNSVLGRSPRTYEAYAQETAAAWQNG